MGFLDKLKFNRLKEGLAKTRDSVMAKVARVIKAKRKIDDELIDEIEEILILGDVGVATTARIIDRLRERVKRERYEDASELIRLLREEVSALFERHNVSTNGTAIELPAGTSPYVIMVVGVNGVGKTTTIGKLAYNYRSSGKRVIIGAADTFRAAANEQLEVWAKRAEVEIIQQKHGSDPAAVAYDTLQSALSRKADVVIIDTAGRLHTKANLMEELKKIKRVMAKLMPDAPHDVLLVLDATTGQNAIQQAKQFSDAVEVTGLVVTKLDGTAKGGVVIGISSELGMPVKYIGVGEQIDDLQVFDDESFVQALFGSLRTEDEVTVEE
ncbi:MAG: signal recognition particle-docking protein FtsY [Bacteroidota bacterium]|jgi:fused signal recognition particle receptor|nr:signal recognition particle-docking protein FtsY [Bacteroidota bacterium]